MFIIYIQDPTTYFVQSDLDLLRQQKRPKSRLAAYGLFIGGVRGREVERRPGNQS